MGPAKLQWWLVGFHVNLGSNFQQGKTPEDMMDRGQMKLDGIDMRSFKSFGQSLADLWSLRREAYQVGDLFLLF